MTLDEDLVSRIISQLPEQKIEILRLRRGYRIEQYLKKIKLIRESL